MVSLKLFCSENLPPFRVRSMRMNTVKLCKATIIILIRPMTCITTCLCAAQGTKSKQRNDFGAASLPL